VFFLTFLQTPIAKPTIDGTAFDLAYGLNGNVKVYSFVAHSHAATSFTGNIVSLSHRRCSGLHQADQSPARLLQVP
jgi:hypothetical protein